MFPPYTVLIQLVAFFLPERNVDIDRRVCNDWWELIDEEKVMTVQQKLQQLQEEIDTLEKEVGGVQEVLGYLHNLNNKRHETFAHTNRMPEEEQFTFKGVIDGKEVSVILEASDIVKKLESNPKGDELRQAKIKMKKVEDLLGGSE